MAQQFPLPCAGSLAIGVEISYIQKQRIRAYPLKIREDVSSHHIPDIIPKINAELLNCTLEPGGGGSCKLSQPADNTLLKLRWYLGGRLLLLLARQRHAHTGLRCNDCWEYIVQQGDAQLEIQ
jgi:hypothetical protein